MPQFNFKKLEVFDNLEILTSEKEKAFFPFHFHDFFCVSLITQGTELLTNPEQSFYATSGTISITQAYEVHQNSSFDDSGYSYKTIYVNGDILTYFNNNIKVKQLERVIYNPSLYTQLEQLIEKPLINIKEWSKAFCELTYYSILPLEEKPIVFGMMDEIIEHHLDRQIDTQWLAREFCMSKFHFIRTFKKHKGVTPQTYIMLYRLKKAKQMLQEGLSLGDTAFMSGFYDSSHLFRAFKRYFGFTTTCYK